MTDIETLASYNDVIMLNGIGILCNTDVMDDIQPWYAYVRTSKKFYVIIKLYSR